MTAGRDRIRGVVRAYPRDDEPPKFNCLADDKSPQPVDALGDGAVGHRQLFGSLAVVMAVMILATACGGEARRRYRASRGSRRRVCESSKRGWLIRQR